MGTSLLEIYELLRSSKLSKTISKGLNYKESRTFNLKRCKDNVIDGLDNLIKGKISYNRNKTEQPLTPWHSLISNLKSRIKSSNST